MQIHLHVSDLCLFEVKDVIFIYSLLSGGKEDSASS